jgi:uncharacterized protein DUF3253
LGDVSKRKPVRSQASKGADEHYFVVDGRRWRRTDPSIPEPFRSELVRALMQARRDVLAAKRADDAAAERTARSLVHDAKLALGERGQPYWLAQDASALRVRAEAAIRALLAHRGPDKTICPSDVARTIGADQWRSVMPLVREVVSALVESGALTVLQRGRPVNPVRARGPIRLALRGQTLGSAKPRAKSDHRD